MSPTATAACQPSRFAESCYEFLLKVISCLGKSSPSEKLLEEKRAAKLRNRAINHLILLDMTFRSAFLFHSALLCDYFRLFLFCFPPTANSRRRRRDNSKQAVQETVVCEPACCAVDVMNLIYGCTS